MPTVTLDPAFNAANITLSNGNLTLTNKVASNWELSRATNSYTAGQLYWEVTCNHSSSTGTQAGVCNSGALVANYIGSDTNGIGYQTNGAIDFGGGVQANIGSWTTGDVVCVALDMGNAKVWFRKNGGNWDNTTDNPATNTGGYALGNVSSGGKAVYPCAAAYAASDQVTVNLGATAFAFPVPGGFTGLSAPPPAANPTTSVATPTGTLQGVAQFSWDGANWQPAGRSMASVATPTGVLRGAAPFTYSAGNWTPAGHAQPGVPTPTGTLDGVAVYTWSGSAWTPAGGAPDVPTPTGTLQGVAHFYFDGTNWQPAGQAAAEVATPYGVLMGVAVFTWNGSAWVAATS